ncbi:MAG: hypothetical protein KGL04_07590 [Elusimicrobia bacterium]|nr:hypothetical protein [Elusimicrobiota bacterium]
MNSASDLAAQEEKGTPFVLLAAILAAVGGLLFGYDTGVISGALIFIRQRFALTVFHEELVVSVALVRAACASRPPREPSWPRLASGSSTSS